MPAQSGYSRADSKRLREHRELVSQLRREAAIQRMMVSESVEMMLRFTLELQETDPLLVCKNKDPNWMRFLCR